MTSNACQAKALCCRSGVHGDLLALAVVTLERHDAFDQRVQGEVTTQADVAARMKLRAALTDENLAGTDFLTAIALHAQHLRIAVAAVLGTTTCFFMCHV